ncbi:unnamed protein product [Paramecium sonneborni]|uniref:Uncharacterized protein n=1 Tax=Paramecium sonneborni TaxID=65129 RepID=A0A8S1KMF9_9CILI|nr:unnamed protein product [Paramecium sonneborni]
MQQTKRLNQFLYHQFMIQQNLSDLNQQVPQGRFIQKNLQIKSERGQGFQNGFRLEVRYCYSKFILY